MITRLELLLILNSCASRQPEEVDQLAELIERGDIVFDSDFNVHATPQGRAKLLILPRGDG